jgi:hypothetical protein
VEVWETYNLGSSIDLLNQEQPGKLMRKRHVGKTDELDSRVGSQCIG